MTVTVRQWDDRSSWNDFVAATPHAHFQQSWEWGELAPQLGGQAIRLAAIEDDAMVGAMQVFVNQLGYLGRTHLYVPRGPALRRPSLQIAGPLLEEAQVLGRRERAIGIRIEPNAPACDTSWKGIFRDLSLQPLYPPTQPRSSWVLDITPDEETLLGAMKSKTRYNVRLSSRKGVEVVEGGPDDLDEFYDLYGQTARRDDFFIHPKAVYSRMFDLFWRAGTFCLLLARYQGKLLAAVTLVRLGATCWYLQGASSNDDRNLMATYLLQWEGIRWGKRQGCSLYDFRAVPDFLQEGQDMYGVFRFKEGFGGCQYTTLHTYGAAYHRGLFGLWQLYFTGRFRLSEWQRRRAGLPARQFA